MRIDKAIIIVLAALPLFAGCAATRVTDAPMQVLVPVLYATNRSLAATPDADELYTSGRGPVSYGVATVALSTRKEGESPFADWSRWQPRMDASRNRNEILDVQPLDAGAFAARLRGDAQAAPGRPVLLYVHGFRRDFEIVAMETAALAYETGADAVPMFFSWPSSNSVFGYTGDTTNMRWAAADLRDTLKYLLRQPATGRVHIVAHSLGGRGLLEALDDLVRDNTARLDKLGEIVLASPDVDSDLFRRDYLPVLRKLGVRTTLYATENDVPLQASQRVNRYKRLGDARAEIFIDRDIETVVYSDVVTFLNSHDAIVEIGDLQADLHYLLEDGLGAGERPTLEAVDTDQGRYWRARPHADPAP
jgi:esterase/lipase superfamily enzyme